MLETKVKYRLVTRSDFDGLVCAVLLKHLDMIDDILFVHPKDMQDGKVAITERDITTNLPFVAGVGMAFDHHSSEMSRLQGPNSRHVIDPGAPSAARVLFRHFGGHERFPSAWDDMMTAVDKADSAQFTMEEILRPRGWVLLNFLMDPRTGLGRFSNFRISNYALMMELIDYCKDHPIGQIMEMPDVRERVDMYNQQGALFKDQLLAVSTMHQNLVVVDTRHDETIYAGNRFMVYALFPRTNISMHVMHGKQKQNTVFAIGKSILNRTSRTDIGQLCLGYGGGGHMNAGTCQIDNERATEVQAELIEKITQDG